MKILIPNFKPNLSLINKTNMEISNCKKQMKAELTPSKLNWCQVKLKTANKTLFKFDKSNTCRVIKKYLTSTNSVNEKHTIVCDWFECQLTGKPPFPDEEKVKLSDNIYVENKRQGTKHFNNLWRLFYKNEIIGTLQTQPRNLILFTSDVMQFKIENHYLYQTDWTNLLTDMFQELQWTVKSLTRVDIAVDGAKHLVELIKKWHSQKYKDTKSILIKGRSKTVILHENTKTFETEKIEYGSLHSDKNAKLYNKSHDNETNGKEYVKEFWQINGFIPTKDKTVWRFEMTLKSAKMKFYDWRQLSDPKFLASILKTECRNWLEFELVSKDTNTSRKAMKEKELEIFDWENLNGQLLTKARKPEINEIKRVKRIIKNLCFDYYSDRETYSGHENTMDCYLNKYELWEWYYNRLNYWLNDWQKLKKVA